MRQSTNGRGESLPQETCWLSGDSSIGRAFAGLKAAKARVHLGGKSWLTPAQIHAGGPGEARLPNR